MSEAAVGSNEVPSCRGGLENLDEEHDYWIDEVDGIPPRDLAGTFLRNGPGRQKIGGKPYGHWFDGDGMLSAFTFKDGRVHFKNAYVRTPKYIRETQAQEILYRGFGTQIPGGLRKNILRMPANPANTSIVYHGERLLALNEGGRPWEVNPETLETVGEFDYDGQIGKTFSAHGKVHPGTGDYINFGTGTTGWGFKPPKPCIDIYRIDQRGTVADKNRLLLDVFPFCHDFALGNRYAAFFINSIVFGDMGGFFLGRHSISDGVRFDPSVPMRIVVVDLDSLQPVRTFETDPGAIIHFGNAFEDGDELVIDAMFAGDFEANGTLADVFNPDGRFGGGTYRRYRLNLTTGAMSWVKMSEHESEFPTFNTAFTGRKHEACYTACSIYNGANSFFNGIQRVSFDGDSTLVTLPPGYYGSEPVYAPAQGTATEGDGYVLEVVYNAYNHKSQLQIFRADNLSEQLCTLHLRHHLPHQFHGYFSTAISLAD